MRYNVTMRRAPCPPIPPLGATSLLFLSLLTGACAVVGCGLGWPPFKLIQMDCARPDPNQINLVLTFDDGPLPADQRFVADDTPETVLASLNNILAALDRHHAQAVFFIAAHVAEPVNNSVVEQRADIFAAGLQSVHDAGHILGYHAFNHAGSIWANPIPIPPLAQARMEADLNQLQDFIDTALAPTGRTQNELFTPVFRQPFGGDGICAHEGFEAAGHMGWSYHGYHIDSGDWTVNLNSDPGVTGRLPVRTLDDLHNFVRQRLKDGAAANNNHDVIDVLMHVNSFTAAHLDEWIDILQEELKNQNRGDVILTVPDCYLNQTDPYIDPAIFRHIITPPR